MVRCTIESRPESEVASRTGTAPQYKVILLDDDTTTFDFVTGLLIFLFHKTAEEARNLTNEVHEKGSALVTVTNLERAELYVEQIRSMARPRGFPLAATIEPA